MILQKEIRDKAIAWKVPADTVDKDYVLGHFLSVLAESYKGKIKFKGGTCLRKCYIEGYRFSEDLDFTAVDNGFILDSKTVRKIANITEERTGIKFSVGKVKPLLSQDQPKGFQVLIKYWGANHSKNQRPLPPKRWVSQIKIEVSTDEILLIESPLKEISHPYSDDLCGTNKVFCYDLYEMVAEKLRALKQRSYNAPRDYYDLYHLTEAYDKADWDVVIPIFLEKMKHKNLNYSSPSDLVSEAKIRKVIKAWDKSIAHQIHQNKNIDSKEIITSVVTKIKAYLPHL